MEALERADAADPPFRILFVCTGNQCRSPLAAAFMSQLANRTDARVEIDSAGLLDNPPTPSPERMVETARARGIDLSAHRSTPLSQLDCSSYDLVVGFERQHIATAVVEGGAPADRTFLLSELVRLIDEAGEAATGDPRAVIEAAARRRGMGTFVPGEELDDPIGRSRADYERVTGEVADLVGALERRLFSGPS